MRLYQKLVLFMLAAAVGPVVVVGFVLLRGAERELEARIGAQQAEAAAFAAQNASRDVDESVESLARAAAPLRWSALAPEEREGALGLVLRQSRHFCAAALLDGTGRELLTLAQPDGAVGLSAEEMAAFRSALPIGSLAGAGLGAVAMSAPFARPRLRAAAVVLAVVVQGEGEPWFVAVEASLGELQRRAEAVSRGGAGALMVLDSDGRLIAGPEPQSLLSAAAAGDVALGRAAGLQPHSSRYLLDGTAVLAVAARTPGDLGWSVVVRLPESEAFASVGRMRRTVLASIGGALLLLLGAGLLFTRGIVRGIERVADGARAFGRGELDVRIPASGADEVSVLAASFNAMGEELGAARAKLETWNEELQRQVELRTTELKAAQAQLLEAQKLAAIGQLGAGVAHEINNPLAGILGNTQLLLLDRPTEDRDTPVLRKIEAQARRAKDITANLLRFSQQRPAATLREVELNRVVCDTLSLAETQVKAEGIALSTQLADRLPAVSGDPGHLAQVLLHLVANARAAMLKAPEKRLCITTMTEDGRVLLKVADTGKGIAEKDLPHIFEPFFTTKDVWSNVGLGLSVSYRIVEEHRGRIDVRTEVGKGTTFTISLPLVTTPA